MIKAAPGADRLKSFVERIEKLEEEKAGVGGDVRDVYAEAKGVGYDVAAMRRLVAYRKLKAADRTERDALDDTYRHALGMATEAVSNGDVSLRQAAEIYGVSKSSIHRNLAVPACPSVEMTADDLGELEIVQSEVQPDAREMTADDLGDPLLVIDRDRGLFRERVRKIAASVKAPIAEPLPSAAPIDITIPAFLDVRRVPA